MKGLATKYLPTMVGALVTLSVLAVKIHSVFFLPRVHNWNYTQLNDIPETTGGYRFAVFGDNKNSIGTFNELIHALNEQSPSFAIDIGDLVFDGAKEKFRFFIKQVQKLRPPLLTVLGNHELHERGRGIYYDIFGPFYYSFHRGDAYFIVLDDADEQGLDPWQQQWLEGELQKAQSFTYRFVFMHVPLYDPRAGTRQRGHSLRNLASAAALNDLFDRYGITMLFTSHIHGYFRGTWNKTPYLITGGAGAELKSPDPEHYFYHYILVQVSDHGVSYTVKKLASPENEWADRLRHDAWIYIYAFFAIHYADILLVLGSLYLGPRLLRLARHLRKTSRRRITPR